ncbi:MAG: glucose-1-phosphate cytidylyltransferase [Anaerolineae bacterium]|nr:glucose-1-phosphate cytidylyltransferase [Anaerolineae bacterium]MCA9887243.1 glucose-1-phosphate cytidylyltransferase [Anaerolineae bacterium]MCA9891653.1 glucose-1-phosphate cytidylyltransferase [Anaerolineae bacterium]
MKVAILAGGVGSRLSEETQLKPKPMVEIGGIPIIWHIMRHYAHYGHNEFYIALGYKGEYIKKYMLDYANLASNLTIDLKSGKVTAGNENNGAIPDWKVSLIDTGIPTMTGGRIKRLAPYLSDDTFFLTWGDGVSDINLNELLAFHKSHGKLATLTAVRPAARFGHLEFEDDQVTRFTEKPQTAEGWINGAFFVMEPGIFDYIEGDATHFEKEPLEDLARDGQLMAYKHESFWQCMDTLRDKVRLDALWDEGNAPWKVWE